MKTKRTLRITFYEFMKMVFMALKCFYFLYTHMQNPRLATVYRHKKWIILHCEQNPHHLVMGPDERERWPILIVILITLDIFNF